MTKSKPKPVSPRFETLDYPWKGMTVTTTLTSQELKMLADKAGITVKEYEDRLARMWL